jgi:hypothetical protein
MEGSMNYMDKKRGVSLILGLILSVGFPMGVYGQEGVVGGLEEGKAQLRLRKTVKTREHQGRSVEVEERKIAPGDTLWQILIQERGLPGKNFQRYLVLVGSLNPQLKNPNVLRVGDVVFIPIRPDEFLGIQIASGRGDPRIYRVKRGEHLFKILRDQQGFIGRTAIRSAFEQVKRLNPRKGNWDLLYVGEAVLLPSLQKGALPTVALSPQPGFIGLDYGLKLPVSENLDLLQKLAGVVGNEMYREGEETLEVKEGTVHIDRSLFPVIENSKLGKRVVLNMEERISPSLQAELQSENPQISVVPVNKESSLHEAADTLFSHLGFQSLPKNRPVVVQDQGVRVQVKGEWMVTNQGKGGDGQEMWIISLADVSNKTPDYLKEYLSMRGMKLKEIVVPGSPLAKKTLTLPNRELEDPGPIEVWEGDKEVLVDTILGTYEIGFSTAHEMSVSLRKGMRLNTTVNRWFVLEDRKYGIFFGKVSPEVKQALSEKKGMKVVELDLETLSAREILSTLLVAMGKGTTYQKHRFPTAEGGPKDKLVLSVPGFFLPTRSMLLTDQTIPQDLHRFFHEKGIRVVYFREAT